MTDGEFWSRSIAVDRQIREKKSKMKMRRSITHGSTETSRAGIIAGLKRKVIEALEREPENIAAVLVIVVPQHGRAKTLQAGITWGRKGWQHLVNLTAEMLKGMGEGIAKGEQQEAADEAKWRN